MFHVLQSNTGIPISEQPSLYAENEVQSEDHLEKENDNTSTTNKSEPNITKDALSQLNTSASFSLTTNEPENSVDHTEITEGYVQDITGNNISSISDNLTNNQISSNISSDIDLTNGADEPISSSLDGNRTGSTNESLVNVTLTRENSTAVVASESTHIHAEEMLFTTGDSDILVSSESLPDDVEVTTETLEHIDLKSTEKAQSTALPTLKEIVIIVKPTPDPHKQRTKGGRWRLNKRLCFTL